MKTRNLNIDGALLNKEELYKHLEKLASNNMIRQNSLKETYPVYRLMENFYIIKEVYTLLNENVKSNIGIHPAGEWLLDNFYIIDEVVKSIKKELTLKKYKNFVGISSGKFEGFARIYVIAAEIINHSDNRVTKELIEECMMAYQKKKSLSMDEIWNISIFLQIAIIENVRGICENIFISQFEKNKVESIVERLVVNTPQKNHIFRVNKDQKNIKLKMYDIKYPFVEYLSYKLKKYGKKSEIFLRALEEIVEKTGTNVSEIIKREHFEIAVNKISMGNSITSIKEIQRINFLDIFEKINGVEEILKQDPAKVYDKMNYKTKEQYRNQIKEISKKTKISEMYIAKKILELAKNGKKDTKESHIGYYLQGKNLNILFRNLGLEEKIILGKTTKSKIYICGIWGLTIIISGIFSWYLSTFINNMWIDISTFFVLLIPISELITQIIQYILNKIIKPKNIPKMDFNMQIPENEASFVIIPTIIANSKKVNEMFRKLEVDYLANKSANLYFCLLGDCKESSKEVEEYDSEVIRTGLDEVQKLNKKYRSTGNFPIFHFIYRKRKWNEGEKSYLGWERKRGAITDFVDLLLNNLNQNEIQEKFNTNSIWDCKNALPKIKYIITLDADTDLSLNSAFELVGAMAHILNKPELKESKVINGYGLIQPRVGINLDISYKSIFTKTFAGNGGIDSYSNSISDTYQDNFGEGIFAGKGIFDLRVYSKVLKNEIPENTVLSHDLLEGNYLRCGFSSDIVIMDGYPTTYSSYITRLSRWIRGDWQIISWLKNKKLNLLSKYKIFDNLRRSLLDFSEMLAFIYFVIIEKIFKVNTFWWQFIVLIIPVFPYVLEIINNIISKREGEQIQEKFTPQIEGSLGAIFRAIVTMACLPYKAYISLKAIVKTIYRLKISKMHLLEWMTSEEAEKNVKNTLKSYIKMMTINEIFGGITLIYFFMAKNILGVFLGIIFFIAPLMMYYISKEIKEYKPKEKLNKQDISYLREVANRTWKYFYDNLIEVNNYLIPDNFQEDRKSKYALRTSSTNIGLSLLAVIAGADLGFISIEEANSIINKIIEVVLNLKKWNGHLFNWYDIRTLNPLTPKYISTVDSGNFVGYLYVTKKFLENQNNEKLFTLIDSITNIIENTDFSKLYSKEHRLFSIGYNIEEDKLTDSYYDLLASEARQASLIAIAKRDVDVKHWEKLSRTLTVLNNKKGLISWSGTAFEYLMPNINIPRYKGSLIDESIKFAEMCQIQYAKLLGTPWGISESAFNVKDLHSNYQYKAFGIPWLGLKRGLADEVVISSYASVLAILDKPKEVIKNLKELEKYGMYNEYGFYESYDFSIQRLKKDNKQNQVRTYMAHHQALILLSINNLLNHKIFQKRFMDNPEINAVSILLQEKMPEKFIVTKEEKEKPEKLRYEDYENYSVVNYKKTDERLIRSNVISNGNYTIAINQKGYGFSKVNDIYVNRFKETNDYFQGIFVYLKNIQSKNILRIGENAETTFTQDSVIFEQKFDYIKTKLKITLDQEDSLEIRSLEIENTGNREEVLEITSILEPILSTKEQDMAHSMFNNLFIGFNYDSENNILEVKRKKRTNSENDVFLEILFLTDCETVVDNEFEIEKEKIKIRGDFGIPNAIEKSLPFSKKLGLTTEPIAAIKKTIRILSGEKKKVNLIFSVGTNREETVSKLDKYKNFENVERSFAISKAKAEAENRYLEIKSKDFEIYQKILGYLLFYNPIRNRQISNLNDNYFCKNDLWKYGISGDHKIILVKIRDINDVYVISQVLKMYEFFLSKNIKIELVFLDEEQFSYQNYVKEEIESKILDKHLLYKMNINGGIFVLSKNNMPKKDINLINFVSALTIDTHLGDLNHLILDLEEEYLKSIQNIPEENQEKQIEEIKNKTQNEILKNIDGRYYNEYGAFYSNNKEYIIQINKNKRLPTVWSNIMANKNFGTLVTENMGGYTWYKNSRLNRISSWQNEAFMDIPSEVIYMEDMKTCNKWSLGLNPMPDENEYKIIYGFGYSKYLHESSGITQELEVFVPNEDNIKVNILKLTNNTIERKKMKIVYYIKPVLGEDEIKTDGNIKIKYDENANMIFAGNMYETEFNNKVYVSSSEKIKSFTGDKKSFFGKGDISNPEGLNKIRLNNNSGFGMQNCIAIQIEVELESFGSKEIALNLGVCDDILDGKNISYKYCKLTNCRQELEKTKINWKETLEKIQVNTPIESLNIMLNGWTLYQTIVSRLFGRTGFYQSGGAYGFRDQLQDTLCLKFINPEMMKDQIIKHSKHQFLEGDVEHWWHEETKRGIRTRFSDDLLWLVFCIEEYIDATGDKNILEIETPYLQGEILKQNEEEKYDLYKESDKKGTLYEHCIKAIEKSLNFGKHFLPKIGTGDWNDGFSKVGNEGKGESVWLGFFMYNVIQRFMLFVREKNDFERYDKYNGILAKLKKALNTDGWDGRWYRRAFMDNGNILGSLENEECRIDGISQSWAVISNAGENEKKQIAIESLENHLVDKQNGIIKLLDPPFNNGKIDPGYIKAYLPGVRENGGQYTHECCSCGQFLANMLEIKPK